jgi:hypothetical protein
MISKFFKKLELWKANLKVVRFRSGLYAVRRGNWVAGYKYLDLKGKRGIDDTERFWWTRANRSYKDCVTSDLPSIKTAYQTEIQRILMPVDIKDPGVVVPPTDLDLDIAQSRLSGTSSVLRS